MATRTKIICTMGPAVNSLDKIIELIEAGMNVARLNFSHGTKKEHEQVIHFIKQAREKTARPIAIMLDTKGPEIRLGGIAGGEVKFEEKNRWLLVKDVVEGDKTKVSILPPNVLDCVHLGTKLLFDDGYISSHVVEIREDGVLIEIDNPGTIRSGKGVNIPKVNLNLPAVTEKDIDDIRFGCLHDVDMIAASFVRSVEHVLEIKRLLKEEGKNDIQVFAKIENIEGVNNFDSIVQVADGIMIARGDLGVEIPLAEVPPLQKMMIRKSYLVGKPSITATQMLESMIYNPRPTRAEVSDVANAIYDSTSALMLSGETAIGKYPLEAVRMMKSIVKEIEKYFDYRTFFNLHAPLVYHDVPSALTLAAVKTAYSSKAQAIFAFTSSGSTARLLSRLRPEMPIIAMTHQEKCYHQMSLNWGVIPFLGEKAESVDDAFKKISDFALEKGVVSFGDFVVLTAGTHFGFPKTTNMMIVESIGDVLVRALTGYGQKVHGNIILVFNPELVKPYSVKDCLIVLTQCDASYLPLIKEAAGIILQNHIDDLISEQYALETAKQFDKPVIIRADAASRNLKEGQLVTLDPEKALVYKGVVF
ncbi:MAG TPA: pyruvate kinase [Parachlamydiaceae bacterium]|nr:pyruvate kinase [Parachlamydiaceae bacterium]